MATSKLSLSRMGGPSSEVAGEVCEEWLRHYSKKLKMIAGAYIRCSFDSRSRRDNLTRGMFSSVTLFPRTKVEVRAGWKSAEQDLANDWLMVGGDLYSAWYSDRLRVELGNSDTTSGRTDVTPSREGGDRSQSR